MRTGTEPAGSRRIPAMLTRAMLAGAEDRASAAVLPIPAGGGLFGWGGDDAAAPTEQRGSLREPGTCHVHTGRAGVRGKMSVI